jgi:hypothetical protein
VQKRNALRSPVLVVVQFQARGGGRLGGRHSADQLFAGRDVQLAVVALRDVEAFQVVELRVALGVDAQASLLIEVQGGDKATEMNKPSTESSASAKAPTT